MIILGDCLIKLKELPDNSVDCVVTSPPYWALRDYGVAGQLGLEPTFQEYITKLCDIFDEVKRVLKDEGTCWVNIGDTYMNNSSYSEAGRQGYGNDKVGMIYKKDKQVKEKSLCCIPDRFKIEMINRGWICRNEIIWFKPNCMPSSVKDRFTVDFEKVFFFVKQKKYFFKTQYEPHTSKNNQPEFIEKKFEGKENNIRITHGGNRNPDFLNPQGRNKRCVWDFSKYDNKEQESEVRQGMHKERGEGLVEKRDLPNQKEFVDKLRNNFTAEQITEKTKIPLTKIEHWFRYDESGFSYPSKEDWEKLETDLFPELKEVWYETDDIKASPNGRIKRTVWQVTTKPYKEAHFATYPEKLIEPMIDAGCPVGGVVLDPFFGAGTTGVVALKQDKKFIGVEINLDYIKIAESRINTIKTQTKLSEVGEDD